jgi:hypothetical protein
MDEGAVVFDILPFKLSNKHHPPKMIGMEFSKLKYKYHSGIGGKFRKVVCLQSVGKVCPICKLQEELFTQKGGKLYAKNQPQWKDPEVKALFAKERVVMMVLIRSGDHKGKLALFDSWYSSKPTPNPHIIDQLSNAAEVYKMNNELNEVFYASIDKGCSISAIVKTKAIEGQENTYQALESIQLVARKTPLCLNTMDNETLTHLEWFINYRKGQNEVIADILNIVPDPIHFLRVLDEIEIEKLIYQTDDVPDAMPEYIGDPIKNEYTFEDDTPLEDMKPVPVVEKVERTEPLAVGVQQCPSGYRFAIDFKKDPDVCEECDLFVSCKKANKLL